MATGKVDIKSDIIRKRWVQEGLVQAKSMSFWTPWTGGTMDSIVHQVNNAMAGAGHTVVFNASGSFSGQAVADRETAYGTGEEKTLFSNKLVVRRYRVAVDNGDKFDQVEIGNLNIGQHSDSRSKLSDLFIRIKDQSLFDASQGLNGQKPSHIIDLGTEFGYHSLIDIGNILKTSRGFATGDIRRPLRPYTVKDGQKCWFFIVDSAMATMLRKEKEYKALVFNADVRGNENRAIKGVFGKIGNLILVEADNFFGKTSGSSEIGIGINDSRIEMQGLRQKSAKLGGKAYWTGEAGFDYEAPNLYSRGFLLGTGGFQMGFGMMPDYKLQFSTDFKITSESALEFWMHTQKTKLKQESGPELDMAKVANMDNGIIAVDFQVKGSSATRGAFNDDGSASGDSGASGQSKFPAPSDGAGGESDEVELTPGQKGAATRAANRAAAAEGDGASGDSNENSK